MDSRSDSFTDIPLDNRIERTVTSKKTWRSIFRVTAIILLIICVVVSSISLNQHNDAPLNGAGNQATSGFMDAIKSLEKLMSQTINELNQVVMTTSVQLPNRITKFGQDILDQVTQMVRQCNAVCRGPGVGPSIQNYVIQGHAPTVSFDPISAEYQKFVFGITEKTLITAYHNPWECLRFPSQHLFDTTWCVSYQILTQNCSDHGPRITVIQLGEIMIANNLSTVFRDPVIKYIRHHIWLRSCSVVAYYSQCTIFCTSTNKSEPSDYADTGYEQLFLATLQSDGTFTEHSMHGVNIVHQWNAIYGGVGNGVIIGRNMLIPLYGGINYYDHNTTIVQTVDLRPYPIPDSCSQTDNYQTNYLPSMFTNSYYGTNLVVSGYLSCRLMAGTPTSCSIRVIPIENMTMGSEGQFYLINNQLYYYKRSSNWIRDTQVYLLSYSDKGNIIEITSAERYIFKSVTSPDEGDCVTNHGCPSNCIGGLFQAPWILNDFKLCGSNITCPKIVTVWADQPDKRSNPMLSIAETDKLLLHKSYINYHTAVGYSTVLCFDSPKLNLKTCVVLQELMSDDKLLIRISYSIVSIMVE
ncbi:hemagglutinin-neuraminidase [Tuhoko virus 1]|uniref:Hemagglutinin-neuraminidase n=1 Tax=Tuhoko virus 1 TaxID=798072 RepID=D8WJ27_9MONO|nr:hemagglutinin-neuraminidase [Tuhoko virus 1]ADI80714.1 hemagglutinin-neuraminidase [Tuhoko virus 1]